MKVVARALALFERLVTPACKGEIVECSSKVLCTSQDFDAALSRDEGPVRAVHTFALMCPSRRERCEACPRFQAMRQLVAIRKHGINEVQAVFRAAHGEPNVGDGDGKGAEVHDCDSKTLLPVREQVVVTADTQSDTVLREGSPSVQEAEQGANQGNGEGYSLDEIEVHGRSVEDAMRLWITRSDVQQLDVRQYPAADIAGRHGNAVQ
jgi:hypothetical protein